MEENGHAVKLIVMCMWFSHFGPLDREMNVLREHSMTVECIFNIHVYFIVSLIEAWKLYAHDNALTFSAVSHSSML